MWVWGWVDDLFEWVGEESFAVGEIAAEVSGCGDGEGGWAEECKVDE